MNAYSFSKQNGTSHKKVIKKSIGILIILSGLFLVGYFFFPVISYQVFYANSMREIEVPVPKRTLAVSNSISGLFAQGFSQITTDFTDARNWYPQIHGGNKDASVKSYSLSIPNLKIENAEVSTTDYDLEKHLIQYAGTSTPGERGTSVIFGHSTLPQFFKPDNYKTIFGTLHTIKEGDKIFAEVKGKKYTYTVFSKIITTPEDTDMFVQSFDTSYITIVTCTPPGTVWKRLVVKARLDASGDRSAYLQKQRIAKTYGTN